MKKRSTRLKDIEWHKAVCERDDYTCYMCKKSFNFACYFNEKGINQYVCADHIKTKKARPDLRHDINNGRCVCFNCHLIRHS
jgi:hypothetical protein